MVMWQHCVGGRFLDVRNIQEDMRQRNVQHRWEKVCVNCRGTQGAGDQRCPVRDRQVEAARIRVVQKVSYAEAVKRVVEEDGSRVRDAKRILVRTPRSIESAGPVPGISDISDHLLRCNFEIW